MGDQIEALFEAGRQARAAGDAAGWLAQMEAVLALDPDEPRALNALGNAALRGGDLPRAQGLFERAAKAKPDVAPIWFNLAQVHARLGAVDRQREALIQTLTADPYFVAALIALGELDERAGRRQDAAGHYRNALAAQGEQPATPGLTAVLERARRLVAEADAARAHHLEARLAGHEAGLEGAALRRFADCRRAFAGELKLFESTPTYLKYPYLPAIQFFERDLFPWLADIEAATDAIRAEYLAVRASTDFVPYINFADGQPLEQWQQLNRSDDWDSYHLWQNGRRDEAHCAACPATVAAISAIGQPVIAANAPNLMFSRLKPRTHIPPHSGMTNTRLVVHLPLIIPPGCTFRVGNETREWKVGEAWVFDDSIDHEARNDSDEERVILMWDVWNPLLSAEECRAVAALVEADTSHVW